MAGKYYSGEPHTHLANSNSSCLDLHFPLPPEVLPHQIATMSPPQERMTRSRARAKKKAAATEVEPRRSVRATKGQHTKSFDELEPTAAAPPKRRQTKKSKKAQEQEQEQETTPDELEEIIRCICGATEQDEDSGEAWIGCETCLAWQHNVCVGVSSFEDEIPDHYYCERCRPEDHKELLEGMARGEKPWEARRKAAEDKKKRKGGRKGKGKRASDQKDKEKEREREKEKEKEEAEKEKQREREKEEEKQRELEIEREKERQKELEKQREEQEKAKEAEAEAAKAKAKPSPAPAPETSAKDKKETTGKGKRKAREDSQDAEGKVCVLFLWEPNGIARIPGLTTVIGIKDQTCVSGTSPAPTTTVYGS